MNSDMDALLKNLQLKNFDYVDFSQGVVEKTRDWPILTQIANSKAMRTYKAARRQSLTQDQASLQKPAVISNTPSETIATPAAVDVKTLLRNLSGLKSWD